MNMFLRLLRAELMKYKRFYGTFLLIIFGSLVVTIASVVKMPSFGIIDEGTAKNIWNLLQYYHIESIYFGFCIIFPIGMAFVSDLFSKADADNWPILYAKNIRFQYFLVKIAILYIVSFFIGIFFLIFFGYGLSGLSNSAELIKPICLSLGMHLIIFQICILPIFMIYALFSVSSRSFLATIFAFVLFILYSVAFHYQEGEIKQKLIKVDPYIVSNIYYEFITQTVKEHWYSNDLFEKTMEAQNPPILVEWRNGNVQGYPVFKRGPYPFDNWMVWDTKAALFNLDGSKVTSALIQGKIIVLYTWLAYVVGLFFIAFIFMRKRDIKA